LYGLIGVDMQDRKSPLNYEDIQLLQTIANQTAIAIENNNYIRESAELIRQLTEADLRKVYTKQLEKTNKELDAKNAELTRLFRELQEKETQLVHSEKMASLGQLVAGISHELNNPISYIYTNSRTLSEYLDSMEELWSRTGAEQTELNKEFLNLISELKSMIADNISGSRSVKELVLSLKDFSRLDQAEWKEARLVPGIENSLKVLQSQVSKDVEIIREFHDDPVLFCNPGQLNQVFINLFSNAIQALNGKGKIFIRTRVKNKKMFIEVEDTGSGIKKEIIPKIFDPFFTTKDVNKGTGLGLSISYSIIKKHNGELNVKSEEGKGSTFTVIIPVTESAKDEKQQ
jgi:two-component system NtrC family sensor kinase